MIMREFSENRDYNKLQRKEISLSHINEKLVIHEFV